MPAHDFPTRRSHPSPVPGSGSPRSPPPPLPERPEPLRQRFSPADLRVFGRYPRQRPGPGPILSPNEIFSMRRSSSTSAALPPRVHFVTDSLGYTFPALSGRPRPIFKKNNSSSAFFRKKNPPKAPPPPKATPTLNPPSVTPTLNRRLRSVAHHPHTKPSYFPSSARTPRREGRKRKGTRVTKYRRPSTYSKKMNDV